jgi:hypothetical protein
MLVRHITSQFVGGASFCNEPIHTRAMAAAHVNAPQISVALGLFVVARYAVRGPTAIANADKQPATVVFHAVFRVTTDFGSRMIILPHKYEISFAPPKPKPLDMPDVPVTGDNAVAKDELNACPPLCITPDVFACLDTNTAIMATPIIAVSTVTTDATKLFSIFPHCYEYVSAPTPVLALKLMFCPKLLDPPVIGASADFKMLLNALPPDESTPAVFACFETRAAMIATPIIAVSTTMIGLMILSMLRLKQTFIL